MKRVNRRDSASTTEDQAFRVALPWAVWGLLPFVGVIAWAFHRLDGSILVPVLLAFVTVALVLFANHQTSDRSGTGRAFQSLYILTLMGWVTAFSMFGFSVRIFAVWFAGGIGLCLAWNVRYATHSQTAKPLFEKKASGASGAVAAKSSTRKPLVDWSRLARALGSRLPAIAAPAPVPAIEAPAAADAKVLEAPATAEDVDPANDPRRQKEAEDTTRVFVNNLERLKVKEPKYARMRTIVKNVTPFRASGLFKLQAEDPELPDEVVNLRNRIAKINHMGPARIQLLANRDDFTEVIWNLIIQDTLAEPRDWKPPAPGGSVGDQPVTIGFYEDGKPELVQQAPVWTITRVNGGTKVALVSNLTHIGVEGMPGSGKSNTARIIIAEDVLRDDVEDWAIDVSKGAQTLGPIAPNLEWVAQEIRAARKMVTFLVNVVIRARANYLASPQNRLGRPLDGWVPGCGLPFLRVLIEEAGMVANELGDLYKLFNLARSAGVALILSAQRFHSGVIDTNVRSALGSIMSFGVKNLDDAFLLDDELVTAGADPSQWKADAPGKHYFSQPGLEIDRQLMVARTMRVDEDLMRAFVTEHAEQHRARLKENFPEWYAMLAHLDKSGVWTDRKSGQDMLDDLDQGMADFMIPGALDLSKATAQGQSDTPQEADVKIRDLMGRGARGEEFEGLDLDEDFEDEDEDDDLDGEFGEDRPEPEESDVDRALEVFDTALGDEDGFTSEEDRAELARLAADMVSDPGAFTTGEEFDPGPPDPADVLSFGDRDDSGLPREQALGYLYQWLAHQDHQAQGAFTISGSQLYRQLGGPDGPVGHKPSWFRTQVRTMCEAGLLAQEEKGGQYTVTSRMREVAPVQPVAPQEGADLTESDAA